jgi:hypothetical protein
VSVYGLLVLWARVVPCVTGNALKKLTWVPFYDCQIMETAAWWQRFYAQHCELREWSALEDEMGMLRVNHSLLPLDRVVCCARLSMQSLS